MLCAKYAYFLDFFPHASIQKTNSLITSTILENTRWHEICVGVFFVYVAFVCCTIVQETDDTFQNGSKKEKIYKNPIIHNVYAIPNGAHTHIVSLFPSLLHLVPPKMLMLWLSLGKQSHYCVTHTIRKIKWANMYKNIHTWAKTKRYSKRKCDETNNEQRVKPKTEFWPYQFCAGLNSLVFVYHMEAKKECVPLCVCVWYLDARAKKGTSSKQTEALLLDDPFWWLSSNNFVMFAIIICRDTIIKIYFLWRNRFSMGISSE